MTAKFHVEFVVQGERLGDLMEVLQRFKVEDFHMKIVAGTAAKIRDGTKTAVDAIASIASTTPRPTSWFKEQLARGGFAASGVPGAVDAAFKRKLIKRKKVNGFWHYTR